MSLGCIRPGLVGSSRKGTVNTRLMLGSSKTKISETFKIRKTGPSEKRGVEGSLESSL